VILARQALEDRLELIEFEEAFRTLCSASMAMCGMVATMPCRSPSLNMRFKDASSRLTVAGAAFSFSRSVL